MCRLTGYPEEELVGKHFSDITHPDDLDRSREMTDRLMAGEISNYE